MRFVRILRGGQNFLKIGKVLPSLYVLVTNSYTEGCIYLLQWVLNNRNKGNNMKRAKIQLTSPNSVRLQYVDPITDEDRDYEVYCPYGKAHDLSGYIKFSDTDQQVCENLYTTGATLHFHGNADELLEVVRDQYRAMKRSAQRILSGI